MKNNKQTAHRPRELLGELQALVGEAETMMADSLSEHSAEAFRTLRGRFNMAQERFTEAYAGVRKKVLAGANGTDDAIRTNPYQSLAIAAGIGLLVGVLVGRRGD